MKLGIIYKYDMPTSSVTKVNRSLLKMLGGNYLLVLYARIYRMTVSMSGKPFNNQRDTNQEHGENAERRYRVRD